jgi:hypothetical protein
MLTVTPVGTLLAWSDTQALNPPEVVIVIGIVVATPGNTEMGWDADSVNVWAFALPVRDAKQTSNPAANQRPTVMLRGTLRYCCSASLISRPCSFTFMTNSSTECIVLVMLVWPLTCILALRLTLLTLWQITCVRVGRSLAHIFIHFAIQVRLLLTGQVPATVVKPLVTTHTAFHV